MTPAGPVEAPPAPGFQPPPGPGVAPPFAAPPFDRSRRSLWIGLIVGGVGFVLCCAGGLFGFGLLVVASTDQTQLQVRQTVQTFIEAVRDEDLQKAHDQLCAQLAPRVSPEQIGAEFGQHPLAGYAIGPVRISGQTASVEAQLRYSDQAPRRYVFTLVPEGTDWKICRWQ